MRGADHRFSIDLRDESVVMLLAKPGPGRPSGERPHDIVIPIHFVGEGRTAMAMNPVLFLAPVGGGPQKVCAAVIELPILGGQTGPEEALVEIELAPLE